MSKCEVVLSEQDLGDFLDGNEDHMIAYAAELKQRLSKYFDEVTVEIDSNALTDMVNIDHEQDECGFVAQILNNMVNDWDWL